MAEGTEQVSHMAKRIAVRPRMKDMLQHFGDEHYNPKTDTLTLKGKQAREAQEAFRDHRRLEAERGHTLAGRRARPEMLRHRDGSVRPCSPQNADMIGRMTGAKPVVNWATRVARYSVDEEGYLFIGGEPTGHTHIGEPMPWVAERCRGCIAERAS